MITVVFTMVYLAVSLLLPTSRRSVKPSRKAHTPRHRVPPTVEEQFTQLFIEEWLKGQEEWIKYAWIVPDFPTVSW